jgi:hypothetical protein
VPKSGTQFTYGKRDYFGLVIAFRYLLPNDSFREYKRALSKLILQYCKQSSRIQKVDLLYTMGLPENWEKSRVTSQISDRPITSSCEEQKNGQLSP